LIQANRKPEDNKDAPGTSGSMFGGTVPSKSLFTGGGNSIFENNRSAPNVPVAQSNTGNNASPFAV
jgi:hypothetical protein